MKRSEELRIEFTELLKNVVAGDAHGSDVALFNAIGRMLDKMQAQFDEHRHREATGMNTAKPNTR